MLPGYVLVFAWLGGAYAFADEATTNPTPALRFIDEVHPLELWGCYHLVVAGLVLAGMVTGARTISEVGLVLGGIVSGLWAILTGIAVIYGQAPPSAPARPVLALLACWASYRSLADDETPKRPLRRG